MKHLHASRRAARAFAPATVANVAVGFEVLGFALDGVGDTVDVRVDPAVAAGTIVLDAIEGVVTQLPSDPQANTAAVALQSMIDELGWQVGFRVRLRKGIPLSSGMGGSAASAVAAVVAANALLDRPLSPERLLVHALAGEAAATGAAHADNVAPCLFGGMTAIVAPEPPRVIALPVPDGIQTVLVHPCLQIDTKSARAALERSVPLERCVEQSMRLTGFIAGCYREDPELIRRSMVDLIAGPQRARMIGGFDSVRGAALRAGAIACAISGSGPSLFAWTGSMDAARAVASSMREAFDRCGTPSDSWISQLGAPAARVIPREGDG